MYLQTCCIDKFIFRICYMFDIIQICATATRTPTRVNMYIVLHSLSWLLISLWGKKLLQLDEGDAFKQYCTTVIHCKHVLYIELHRCRKAMDIGPMVSPEKMICPGIYLLHCLLMTLEMPLLVPWLARRISTGFQRVYNTQ